MDVIEPTLRKHITLTQSTYKFLTEHQHREKLPSFSAAIEAAAEALKKQDLIAGYEQFAADYAASKEMKEEAAAWLNKPMED